MGTLAKALLIANLAASPSAWPAPPWGPAPAPMLYLTSIDNGRSLDIEQGSEIQLRLSENASTGYRWSLGPLDPALIELVTERTQTNPSDAAGSQGQPVPAGNPRQVAFRFKALRPGRTEITLRHLRSWEGDRSTIDRFRLSLHIDAKSAHQGGPHPGLPVQP